MTNLNTIEIVCFVIPPQVESYKVVNDHSFVIPTQEESHKVNPLYYEIAPPLRYARVLIASITNITE